MLQMLSSYYHRVSRLSAVLVEIKRCGCTSRQILNLLKAKIVKGGGHKLKSDLFSAW